MHDLRLVGVHEDGEHLLLSDAEGGRFLLAVDDALRAAVRRDRPHLGQLQIEIEGGLRPRDVQARIRAGATAEEVAALAGWPVEKVRRYEGPVLAEREHVAGLARDVRLRRRGGAVTLGAEVARRLTARGVDLDQVRWDSWRVDGDPWTVVVTFPAGGRERAARWHFDLSGRSVTPGDDEARWLSEDQPEGEGPLAGARLTAVPLSPGGASTVYDVEVDGGIGVSSSTTRDTARTGSGEALDLVGAMRARRAAGRGRRRDGHGASDARPDTATELPTTGTHPAGRRRPRPGRPEPLDLDPTLLDDPPAAHPSLGIAPDHDSDRPAAEVTALPHAPRTADPLASNPLASNPLTPSTPRLAGHWPLAEEMRSSPAPALLPATRPHVVADESAQGASSSTESSRESRTAADDGRRPDNDGAGRHRHPGRREVSKREEREAEQTPGAAGTGRPGRSSSEIASSAAPSGASTASGTSSATSSEPQAARTPSRRTKRSSVPSWDDIMFGTKQD
ncbi:MAG TPA: septation protein SepH [Actinomycetales bacterium]|nr:septation protein SepH [Actinomycetales bacterium]